MDAYRQRTGKKLTYELLAEQTGIALTTLQSLAARPGYNIRLGTIEKLCVALECSPSDLLEMSEDGGARSSKERENVHFLFVHQACKGFRAVAR